MWAFYMFAMMTVFTSNYSIKNISNVNTRRLIYMEIWVTIVIKYGFQEFGLWSGGLPRSPLVYIGLMLKIKYGPNLKFRPFPPLNPFT